MFTAAGVRPMSRPRRNVRWSAAWLQLRDKVEKRRLLRADHSGYSAAGKWIGKALIAATMDQLDAWGTTHLGLFTFAHSAQHVALYQKFGFHPLFLTAIMSTPAQRAQASTSFCRAQQDRLPV
jgi:hypothetical protein